MILGVGVDVVGLEGFHEQLSDKASSFVDGSFTEAEQRTVASRPARDKTPYFAGRYAAKEAFLKAWSVSRAGNPPVMSNVQFTDLEVKNDNWGRPTMALHGEVRRLFYAGSVQPRIHLSISHDGPVATAFVVLERSHPASREESENE